MTSERSEHPLPQNPGSPGVQPTDEPDEIRPDLPEDERTGDGESDEDGTGAGPAGNPHGPDRDGEPAGLPREPEPGRS